MGIFKTLWKAESDIDDMVLEHVNLVSNTIVKFREGMLTWLEQHDLEKANQLAFETHQLEGQADDLRRKIEKKLIKGALLARSRRNILDVIERTDKLANAAEASMDFTLLQRIHVPEELVPIAGEIVSKSVTIMSDVQEGMGILFRGSGDLLIHTDSIENIEGEVDELERDFIQELFSLDELELAEKILLRQYLENLVEISDRAEDLSDEMEIITATRKG